MRTHTVGEDTQLYDNVGFFLFPAQTQYKSDGGVAAFAWPHMGVRIYGCR